MQNQVICQTLIAGVTKRKELNQNLSKLEVYLVNAFWKEYDLSGHDKTWLQRKVDRFHTQEQGGKKEMLFLNYVQDFIDNAPKKVNRKTGRKLSDKTIQRYKTANEKLKDFVNMHFKYIELSEIDINFYDKYLEYLTHNLNLAANTVGKEIAVLKTFLNNAKSLGYYFDLDNFKKPAETSDSIYLSEKDLEKLFAFDFSKNKRLEKVRDLFIVGCWTGLRFSDLTAIKPHHVKDDLLHLTQIKTDFPVFIPLHWMTKEILKKYKYKLPVEISNQKFNDYLKEVCKEAGLQEKVTKRITKGGILKKDVFETHELVTTHTAVEDRLLPICIWMIFLRFQLWPLRVMNPKALS
jgi:integrase